MSEGIAHTRPVTTGDVVGAGGSGPPEVAPGPPGPVTVEVPEVEADTAVGTGPETGGGKMSGTPDPETSEVHSCRGWVEWGRTERRRDGGYRD